MQIPDKFYDIVRWWCTLALISVLFKTVRQVGFKELVDLYQNSFSVLFVSNLMVALFFAPIVAYDTLKNLRTGHVFWIPGRSALKNLIRWTIADVVASFMFFEALRLGSLSVAGPLRQTGTIMAFFVGFLFLKERESWQRKLTGSVIVVVGALIIQGFDYGRADVLSSLFAVGAAAVYAVAGGFERYAVDPVRGAGMLPSVFTLLSLMCSACVFALLLYMQAGSVTSALPIALHVLREPHLIVFIVVAGLLGDWLNIAALVRGEVVQVSAVLRLGVLTTILSGWFFFGEDVTDRLFGGLVLVIGVLVVAWPSRKPVQ